MKRLFLARRTWRRPGPVPRWTLIGPTVLLAVVGALPTAADAAVPAWDTVRELCLKTRPRDLGRTFEPRTCCQIRLEVDDIRCWGSKPTDLRPQVAPLPPVPGLAPVSASSSAPSAPSVSSARSVPSGSPQGGFRAVGVCPSEVDAPRLAELRRDRESRRGSLEAMVRNPRAAATARLQAWVDLDEVVLQIALLDDARSRLRSTVCAPLSRTGTAGPDGSATGSAALTDERIGRGGTDDDSLLTIGWTASMPKLSMEFGKVYQFRCPPLSDPRDVGEVWGTDVYGIESAICPAAVHAGRMTFEGGRITLIAEKRSTPPSKGSVRNGVRSATLSVKGAPGILFR